MISYGRPELVASAGGEKSKDTILSNMFVGVLRVGEVFDEVFGGEPDGFVDEELDEGFDEELGDDSSKAS